MLQLTCKCQYLLAIKTLCDLLTDMKSALIARKAVVYVLLYLKNSVQLAVTELFVVTAKVLQSTLIAKFITVWQVPTTQVSYRSKKELF